MLMNAETQQHNQNERNEKDDDGMQKKVRRWLKINEDLRGEWEIMCKFLMLTWHTRSNDLSSVADDIPPCKISSHILSICQRLFAAASNKVDLWTSTWQMSEL